MVASSRPKSVKQRCRLLHSLRRKRGRHVVYEICVCMLLAHTLFIYKIYVYCSAEERADGSSIHKFVRELGLYCCFWNHGSH